MLLSRLLARIPEDPGPHAPILSTRARLITLAFFLAGVTLFVVRAWPRMTHPGIWAEDGTIFYLQDQLYGSGALLLPYAGYLHLICRIIAFVVGPFGVTAVPVAYLVISMLIVLAVFALVLSPRMNRVLPSPIARGCAFILLCGIPATRETMLNVANLIFVGGIALLLLGLSAQPRTRFWRGAEVSAVLLFGFSGPLVVFLSPLFAWRWIKHRTSHNALLVVAVAATALTQCVIYLTGKREAGGNGNIGDVFGIYLQRVVGEWLVGPTAAWNSWSDGGYLRIVAPLLLTAIVVPALYFGLTRAALAWASTVASSTAAALTYADVLPDPNSLDRHLLVPMAALAILAAAGGGRGAAELWHKGWSSRVTHVVFGACGVIAMLSMLGGTASHFEIAKYDHIPSVAKMEAFQECIDSGEPECHLDIAPKSFVVYYAP